MDRADVINTLVTNCDCWKNGAKVLNEMTDDQLEEVARNTAITDLACNGFAHGGFEFHYDDSLGFVANACAPKGQTMAPPAAPTGAAPPAAPPGKAPAGGPAAAPAAEEEAPAAPAAPQPPAKKKPPMATNMTTQEWLATVPPEVAGVFNSALTIVNEEKTRLVTRLTANCTEHQKAAAVAVYNAMSVEQLRAIAPAAPIVRNGMAQAEYDLPPDLRLPTPSFLGAAGGPAVPVGNGLGGYDGWEDESGLSPVQNVQWGKQS